MLSHSRVLPAHSARAAVCPRLGRAVYAFKKALIARAAAVDVEAAPASASGNTTAATANASSIKLQLLSRIAGLDRGALATPRDREAIDALLRQLEGCQMESPLDGAPAPIDGRWLLIYSSVEAFRSSPFFWAFQEGLVQDRVLAADIFRFTDAVPGATIGAAVQDISLATGKLISEVELLVFPFIRGVVVTTSAVAVAPSGSGSSGAHALEVTVENTRVADSNVTPFLEAITVPVQQLMEQVRGSGASKARVDACYCDAELRVMRTHPDGAVFVYRRLN